MLNVLALAVMACTGIEPEEKCLVWMRQCFQIESDKGHDRDWAFEVCAEAYEDEDTEFPIQDSLIFLKNE